MTGRPASGDDHTDGGALYVVSTPIGNMGDFSFRGVETLRSVDAILAEDTRHTRKLLDRYEIATPMIPYHEHVEAKATPGLVARMSAGERFALVSDAGTPLLSDPGSRLVAGAIEAGVPVIPIPGASAMLAALAASGLAMDRFTFFGFLPRSGSERREAFDAIESLAHAAVIYEAPSRLAETLEELSRRGGDARRAVVARELTKQFEELRRGTVAELAEYYSTNEARGEIVIVLDRAPERVVPDELVRDRVQALRREGMSARDAAATVARELGVSKNAAYKLGVET